MCIHGSDPTICKTCSRPKDVLITKPTDFNRAQRYQQTAKIANINMGYSIKSK